MDKVDLHIHTCASDGTWDVFELKKEIIKNKIKIFSITDHDTIKNIENMQSIITKKDNIIFIPGVELSTSYKGREYHLTVYNYDINNVDFNKLVNWNLQTRLAYNLEFIKYMEKINEKVTVKDYLNYVNDVKRGGWKTLNYMIDRKIHNNMYEHFKDIEKSNLKLTFKTPQEVLKILKKDGGKVFLAHPAYYKKIGVLSKDELNFWLENGIDGIECFTPYSTDNKQVEYYINYCKKNSLMISGGSDCHGLFIKERQLGKPQIFKEDINIEKLL